MRAADKIVVIDQGKIAEQGSHEELISLGGIYRDLVKRQIEFGGSNDKQSGKEKDV